MFFFFVWSQFGNFNFFEIIRLLLERVCFYEKICNLFLVCLHREDKSIQNNLKRNLGSTWQRTCWKLGKNWRDPKDNFVLFFKLPSQFPATSIVTSEFLPHVGPSQFQLYFHFHIWIINSTLPCSFLVRSTSTLLPIILPAPQHGSLNIPHLVPYQLHDSKCPVRSIWNIPKISIGQYANVTGHFTQWTDCEE